MLGFIIRRLLQLIPVLFGISFITFALSFIVPGDPVRAIMGQRSDREAELRIRQKFGLDRPWYVQYGIWVRNLVRNPGDLPEFKLRTDDEHGGVVYTFRLDHDMVLASNGEVIKITSKPWQRKILTHLYERGCDTPRRPDGTPYEGGSSLKLIEVDTSATPNRALLEDFQGTRTWFEFGDDLEICSDGTMSGINDVETGGSYLAYYRTEGFHTGRDFTAIFNRETNTVIDGVYDESSTGTAEIRSLQDAELVTITGKQRQGGNFIFELDSGNGAESFGIMPNAVVVLRGNRATVDDLKPGMEVYVALVERSTIDLQALYDSESKDLPEIRDALENDPSSESVSGEISDINLSPPEWFDFGRSYRQQREVREIIRGSFKNTAYLTLISMLIAIIIGVFAGIVSAVKPYSFVDYLTMTGALIGVSMPVFWLGLMLILLFQGQLGWITGTGFGEITWFPVNLGFFSFHLPWHQNIILPSITLATVPMAIIARMTRSSMLEVMNLDYIRTARAKGLGEWAVIIRHALKNSLIPIITVIGVNFALLLAGAVLTETVFSWPGLGREIVDAIEFRDFPVVMAGVVLFAFVFVLVNLVVDVLYAYVDPRIRYQ